MSWSFKVEEVAPAFPGPSGGKYIPVIQAIIDLPADKWLVVGGFSDITECEKMQSAMGGSGGARRAAREQGYRLYTHPIKTSAAKLSCGFRR